MPPVILNLPPQRAATISLAASSGPVAKSIFIVNDANGDILAEIGTCPNGFPRGSTLYLPFAYTSPDNCVLQVHAKFGTQPCPGGNGTVNLYTTQTLAPLATSDPLAPPINPYAGNGSNQQSFIYNFNQAGDTMAIKIIVDDDIGGPPNPPSSGTPPIEPGTLQGCLRRLGLR